MPAMLACLGPGNPNRLMKFAQPLNSLATGHEFQGNVQDYTFGHIANGQFGFVPAEQNVGMTWWLPRLLGSGRQSSYINLRGIRGNSSLPQFEWSAEHWLQFSTKDPDILLSAEGYGFQTSDYLH